MVIQFPLSREGRTVVARKSSEGSMNVRLLTKTYASHEAAIQLVQQI